MWCKWENLLNTESALGSIAIVKDHPNALLTRYTCDVCTVNKHVQKKTYQLSSLSLTFTCKYTWMNVIGVITVLSESFFYLPFPDDWKFFFFFFSLSLLYLMAVGDDDNDERETKFVLFFLTIILHAFDFLGGFFIDKKICV